LLRALPEALWRAARNRVRAEGVQMKRMLINATQPEERRLAIVDGQKLMDFETEIEGREQRKGNIYKAVVTRVEPSLEACFVDYGEDRHGFLPFKEISKNYFREGTDARTARIQDAIKDGDNLLVQVEKEERGNKGAALTTFVSLAGRYLVLMPNNPRGGGVSRRIEGEDREELKENLDQLEYPKGMSLIARTAGIGRTAPELQWDLNYMLKLWTAIDGAAKASKGAFLIYQESSLVIRAIRDYFTADVGEILIDTDDIYEQAQQFMTHVMPRRRTRSSATATTRRCSRASRSSTRSRPRSRARSTCRRAARSSSTTPRRWSRSTSTRRARRAARHRGDRDPHQPRGRRRDRAPDAPARPRRPDRRRLHRHGRVEEPARGRDAPARRAALRPGARPVLVDLEVRPARDEPPAPAPGPLGRQPHHLPALQRHRPHPRHRVQRAADPAHGPGRVDEGQHRGVHVQVPVEVTSFLSTRSAPRSPRSS
jgi:hypothetical protein